ncbi:hypothetical protein OG264_00780 [Streptomyces xanthophaeus]|uniref:hypothetical protein n=1 Tax=Streptomyces xanthophaeus TaxID=67385 RepID=UPI0038655B65|nr:hypothetical protein OG264_00780 [Streptomyces xanthophaeus]WST64866.1 hypothetical protein OG605_37580 [Streptomyces xanthophaeus]
MTGALLGPEVWAGATRNPIPFPFAGNCNGPGEWRYALGFVEFGGEGSSTGLCRSAAIWYRGHR